MSPTTRNANSSTFFMSIDAPVLIPKISFPSTFSLIRPVSLLPTSPQYCQTLIKVWGEEGECRSSTPEHAGSVRSQEGLRNRRTDFQSDRRANVKALAATSLLANKMVSYAVERVSA